MTKRRAIGDELVEAFEQPRDLEEGTTGSRTAPAPANGEAPVAFAVYGPGEADDALRCEAPGPLTGRGRDRPPRALRSAPVKPSARPRCRSRLALAGY